MIVEEFWTVTANSKIIVRDRPSSLRGRAIVSGEGIVPGTTASLLANDNTAWLSEMATLTGDAVALTFEPIIEKKSRDPQQVIDDQLLASVVRKVFAEGSWVDVGEYGSKSGKFILLDTGHVDITDEEYDALRRVER